MGKCAWALCGRACQVMSPRATAASKPWCTGWGGMEGFELGGTHRRMWLCCRRPKRRVAPRPGPRLFGPCHERTSCSTEWPALRCSPLWRSEGTGMPGLPARNRHLQSWCPGPEISQQQEPSGAPKQADRSVLPPQMRALWLPTCVSLGHDMPMRAGQSRYRDARKDCAGVGWGGGGVGAAAVILFV